MALFRNKYRDGTFRAAWWDYGKNAAYFVTLCTQDRAHFFGEIENQKMVMKPLGYAAEKCWYEIPQHFPFVKLDAFVVMPDHVHGIIIIDKPAPVGSKNVIKLPAPPVIQQSTALSKNQFGPQSGNLASIVRGYKIGVTMISKTICPEFKWQRLYHDRIIRNENEYQRIIRYIELNPSRGG